MFTSGSLPGHSTPAKHHIPRFLWGARDRHVVTCQPVSRSGRGGDWLRGLHLHWWEVSSEALRGAWSETANLGMTLQRERRPDSAASFLKGARLHPKWSCF